MPTKQRLPEVRDRFRTRRVTQQLAGEELTQQNYRNECDINQLMARYRDTGSLPINTGVPIYGDFSEVGSFREAHDLLLEAQANFLDLPSDIRARFKNDPGALLDFLQDPKNHEEASRLGLLVSSAPEGLQGPQAASVPAGASAPPAPPTTPPAKGA